MFGDVQARLGQIENRRFSTPTTFAAVSPERQWPTRNRPMPLDDVGHAVIRVRDTGVGMNDSELGIAVEPFRRVAGAPRDGTGLGLPLTKALAEANHADFSIKSRKEHGTLVEVAFPRDRAAQ